MKLKKLRDNHDNKLLKKDQKKLSINSKKKLIQKINSKSVKSNLSSKSRKKSNNNNLFKKFTSKKISDHNLFNKKNVLKRKKIDSILTINVHKKNNFIDKKRFIPIANTRKNNKKNNISVLKGSERRFLNYSKKSKLYPIKNSILQQKFNKPLGVVNKKIVIRNSISILELSNKMAVKHSFLIKMLLKIGISSTINEILDQDTAQLIAEEMGYKVRMYQENALENFVMGDRDLGDTQKKTRPPIVTIIGHVDHGKTSLLDYIRSTKIALGEEGGITQYIGAYHVKTPQGIITFLDTPGHSAFTAMRVRGTRVTDIVVLVVAADDGVMPQTIEAIQHAKIAQVPIIVAINKIDKTLSNIDKIKKELMKYSIISEELGGDNIFVLVSAKTGLGIDNLLSAILLQAEMLELKAVHSGMAKGVVIESYLDSKRGPVATLLVHTGVLKVHDIVICGLEYGKIKLLKNEFHRTILSAGPSIPVEIFGLSGVPKTGDTLFVVRNEKKARELSLWRKLKSREIKFLHQKKIDVDNLFNRISTKKNLDLNIVLKTDTHGSLEAILDSLKAISNNNIVKVNIIASGIGAITETDAYLSLTTTSILVGFNVRADISAKKIIELENLNVKYYSIIYDLINDIKAVMSGLSVPANKQIVIGLAEVRSIFKAPKFGLIAGCMVKEGIIKKTNPIRVLRNNIVIYEGELESLRRFKEDVLEVRHGIECGIGVKNYNDVRIGDIIEVFQVVKK
ncbi:Translation initiation factor IF-2, isoform beta [Buchnera aphidicola (Cinara pseudotaxifoliae)]|uniref:Translation initiation factor IF-2 n=1 Tax=Buchnera aphidicola (Cinara pseudotaxifoliae) TaxID=655384 RepID=A0A451DHA1_9GAMM|nr:translation initiation factor IF-2 [Buchnera aphidicola]VFP85988.1 Translation initiation factor IF-2, isoform beta [Buchnera aphidicola (Cinara pseudotaxifoliae)]